LGLPPENVRVISPHVGGAFGSKTFPQFYAVLPAMAAKVVGRPVKLALARQQMFFMTGYRAPSRHRLQLGADRDGRLTAIAHDSVQQTARSKKYAEQIAVCSRTMWAAPHRRTTHRLLPLDFSVPTIMRGPGETQGMFALESAMDEMAIELISMALHESGVVDNRIGQIVNHDLASYHFAANADIGSVEAHWIDSVDPIPTRSAPRDSERSASSARPPPSPTRCTTLRAYGSETCPSPWISSFPRSCDASGPAQCIPGVLPCDIGDTAGVSLQPGRLRTPGHRELFIASGHDPTHRRMRSVSGRAWRRPCRPGAGRGSQG
ncbi:molybdopterin cofactor-binding domain-containing protein, partial [Streptomyces camponoticapitis]|uniref:molybdopterin cofactor-binding domain-containing protein n=1 Tax=Streptomyces camponoticapitis TaxID=1616125 RepID=UPI001E4BC746